MSGATEVLQNDLNAIIADRAWKFGPVRVRRLEHRHPRLIVTHRIVDDKGRRMSIEAGLPAELVAQRLHNRHMMRIPLDHEEQRVRDMVAETFKGLIKRPARVMLADSDGSQRNSFMCFSVELELLDETLEWKSHLLDYRPYINAGDVPWRFAKTQQRRLKALGGRTRDEALTCCPVLAARIAAADNPQAWGEILEAALAGRADPDAPRFEDGRLVGIVEMTPGAYHAGRKGTWWRRDALSVAARIPDALATSAKGRRISGIVDHPFLPDDAIVSRVRVGVARTIFSAKTTPLPFLQIHRDLLARMERTAG